jgi:hypothetical protein
MSSSAARQAALRKRMQEKGFIQVTVWVPVAQASTVTLAAKTLCENETFELGPMRNVASGKLHKWDG